MNPKKTCAYCGLSFEKLEKEHVFPRNLYPPSKANSNIQRLTIPACTNCNNGWADDEAHFRNLLVVAGDPTTPIRAELWNTTVDRSFSQVDGFKRLKEVDKQMKPVNVTDQERYIVYPAEDPKVVRIMRKIIRGLSYFHSLTWPLLDEKIFVDTLKYKIPDHILSAMEFHNRDKDIVEYRFQIFDDKEIQSAWVITFFQTVSFIAIVSRSNEVMSTI